MAEITQYAVFGLVRHRAVLGLAGGRAAQEEGTSLLDSVLPATPSVNSTRPDFTAHQLGQDHEDLRGKAAPTPRFPQAAVA